MKVVGLIPVRLNSSGLPEKAITDICGLTHDYSFIKFSKRVSFSLCKNGADTTQINRI